MDGDRVYYRACLYYVSVSLISLVRASEAVAMMKEHDIYHCHITSVHI